LRHSHVLIGITLRRLNPVVAPARGRTANVGLSMSPSVSSPWQLDPAVAALALTACALFLQGWLRLRRRGRPEHASVWRLCLFGLGVAAAVLPLVSPLDALSDHYLLSAHMLEHVLLADVSPALLVLAVRGPLTVFLLPPAILRPLAHSARLRQVLAVVLRPAVSVSLWVVVILAWHLPAAYDAALRSQRVHDLEHASFVVVGTLVWIQLVDPTHRLQIRTRLLAALALFAAGQTMSDVLVFSFHAYYPPYAAQPHRVLGLSPVADQRLAGLVMMGEQLFTAGTCVVVLLLALRREAQTVQPARAGRRELV
jgi:putative membrane protein